jgi:hypothetical protein
MTEQRKRPDNTKPSGGYDRAWLDGLQPLDQRYWVECPHCRGVFLVFAPGIDPWHAPALIYSSTRDRDGGEYPDPDRVMLLEHTPCVDCGEPLGWKYTQEVFGGSTWWRHGPELPPKKEARK